MLCYTHAIIRKENGSMRKIRIPKDLLQDLYENQGLTLQQIADALGVKFEQSFTLLGGEQYKIEN